MKKHTRETNFSNDMEKAICKGGKRNGSVFKEIWPKRIWDVVIGEKTQNARRMET